MAEIVTETPPGSDRGAATTAALEAAWLRLGPDYVPRTHLLDAEGRARFVNRLIHEPSPYLRQHAHNPVDWRPWSAETLAEARARGRPVFLSVGYATCHWCHVMEEESFDDLEVAAVLNRDFVPVKLDREQRPDLDQVYITATQLQQGHAGWPNSVWLMPDGRPFHTGTYFPKPQFLAMLAAVTEAWDQRHDQVTALAGRLSEAIAAAGRGAAGRGGAGPDGHDDGAGAPSLGEGVHAALSAQLAQIYNAEEGGFSRGQQFPQESFLLWLLDHWRRTGDHAALGVALHSLAAIADGGLHDHVGGGFHRYTVDVNWRTPHFEKMLYNQALLTRAMVEGWQASGEAALARAARRACGYVLAEMTVAEGPLAGAFHAAEDADSPDAEGRREEGAFYAWTPEAVRAVFPDDADTADWAIATLGLDEAPTIDAGAVPHLAPERRAGWETADWARLDAVLDRMKAARAARARPIRDDKVIAGWNGLMIRALAEAGEAMDLPDLVEAAARAGEAVWRGLRPEGALVRLSAGGTVREAALLEDHAWLGLGFLALAGATGAETWLERALWCANEAVARFADDAGRLRMAAEDGPTGPVYEAQDGATPSGESAALELLARLARREADPALAGAARRLAGALSGALAAQPLARPDALAATRILAAGESGFCRTLGGGAVRARLARPDGRGRARLDLVIAPGWRLGAPVGEGGQDGAAGRNEATAPVALGGAVADWPAGAASAEGPVYTGLVSIPLTVARPVLTLALQPCGEGFCRAPEQALFRLG